MCSPTESRRWLSLHLALADDSTTTADHQLACPLRQGDLHPTPLSMKESQTLDADEHGEQVQAKTAGMDI